MLTFLPVKMRLPLKFGTETIHDIQVAHVELEAYGRVGRGETPLSVGWAWQSALPFGYREQMMCDFCRELAKRLPGAPADDPMTEGYRFLQELWERGVPITMEDAMDALDVYLQAKQG